MNPTQCGQFEMAIVDDILGNLPSNKSQALQDHLAECLSCRKLYAEWREILKDEKSVEPPVSLYNRLAKKFLRRHVRRKTLAPATIWGATRPPAGHACPGHSSSPRQTAPGSTGATSYCLGRYPVLCTG